MTTEPKKTAADLVAELHDELKEAKSKSKEDPRIILLSVDGSKFSVDAVEWAQKNALRTNDLIVLLTVWEELIDLSEAAQAVQVDPLGFFYF